MFVISSLKHNKFKKVDIPRNSDYFRSLGLTRPGVSYSGDEVIKHTESKVEMAAAVAREAFVDSND